jgi:D-arabinose 1-dehydrogenase-like Zn-dependent alcohol dehydrogenase
MEFEKMAQMMKAGVVHQFGHPLVIEDVPVPTPGAGEILVKVMACAAACVTQTSMPPKATGQ